MSKIDIMYDIFGVAPLEKCKNCGHLVTYRQQKLYHKCEIYGKSNSAATDWKVKQMACGMFNRPYSGEIPIYKIKPHNKKADTQCNGQIDFCGAKMDKEETNEKIL